jgi:hypothetical protein
MCISARSYLQIACHAMHTAGWCVVYIESTIILFSPKSHLVAEQVDTGRQVGENASELVSQCSCLRVVFRRIGMLFSVTRRTHHNQPRIESMPVASCQCPVPISCAASISRSTRPARVWFTSLMRIARLARRSGCKLLKAFAETKHNRAGSI